MDQVASGGGIVDFVVAHIVPLRSEDSTTLVGVTAHH